MAHNQTGFVEQIYNSRKNILDILEKQGFNIDDYKGSSINDIHNMIKHTQLDMLLKRKPTDDESKVSEDDGIGGEKNNKKAYVIYHVTKTLSLNNILEYIEDLYTIDTVLTKKDDLIIIIKDEPNESLIKLLQNKWEQEGIFIIVFNIKRLQYNILNHQLNPPHIVLTKEETVEFKKKYNITHDSQIPNIFRFSPTAQVIGIRPGDVCKIIRPSKTSITSNFYRICSS
jgi:DNA-directed RNA polymerase subunit H (RpoH/RPB5)